MVQLSTLGDRFILFPGNLMVSSYCWLYTHACTHTFIYSQLAAPGRAKRVSVGAMISTSIFLVTIFLCF